MIILFVIRIGLSDNNRVKCSGANGRLPVERDQRISKVIIREEILLDCKWFRTKWFLTIFREYDLQQHWRIIPVNGERPCTGCSMNTIKGKTITMEKAIINNSIVIYQFKSISNNYNSLM